jgi:hypothetical protein
VNVAEAALAFSDGYKLRDQLWLELKKWLEGGGGRLPQSRELIEDLVTPTYKFASDGRIIVESKDSIRRRGKRSPDLADCLILSFASESATLIQGSRTQWQQPIRRGLQAYG